MENIKFSIDEKYLTSIAQELVRINSINPSLTAEGKGEAEIGEYVANQLNDLGLAVTTTEIAPGRVNVVGVRKGSGGGKSLLLNAHMDTVGVEGMTINPFEPKIRDGRLYGRGSMDMKGSLAAMMAAAKALVDFNIMVSGDLLITAVADEEHSSIGTEALVQEYRADAAIVTEPTDMHICRAHRGFIWYDVEIFGRAAHGSRFQEGIDANIRMGRFLAELDLLEKKLRKRKGHKLAGPPSLHAATLRGGEEISTYAAHCLLQIERRTIPGETIEGCTMELQQILDHLSKQDTTFKGKVKPDFWRPPFEVEAEIPIVKVLDAALGNRLGNQSKHIGQAFWTDAALFSEAGMETVLLGPKGFGLHGAEEWVDIGSLVDLAYVLAEATINYCR